MRWLLPRWSTGLVLLLGVSGGIGFAERPAASQQPSDEKAELPDLAEYRTVETAITSRLSGAGPAQLKQPAYLGVHVVADSGRLVVEEVAADSPAARAGLQPGDVLVQLAGQGVASADALRELLQRKAPGDAVPLAIRRQDQPRELTATLATLGRPMKPTDQRAVLGLQVGQSRESAEGVPITQIAPGSPAEKAKLKVGEIILKLDGTPITGPDKLRDLLAQKKPDESVTVTLFLAEKALDLKLQLGGEQAAENRSLGWERRAASYWRKDVYRLAVVCIEYPDVKHNPKIPPQAWADAFFSRGTYTNTSATGQTVHGSMNDYYLEQSHGALRVEGKVFDYVEVSKNRTEYAQGNRYALLTEALDKLLERDGKDALKDFDGLCFLYAGGRVATARGGLYWPHRSNVSHQGKRWPYFICQEGGERMGNISVFCHEFGHLLGLPDLYARPENPGSEGVSAWCAMSNQAGAGRDRSDRAAEADPGAHCGVAAGVLQGPRPA
jgi:M6 family metalloprotease-like protein